MKKGRILIAVFCMLILLVYQAESQIRASAFFLTGSLKVDQGIVDGAQIQFNRNGALVQTITVNRTGNFRYSLELNATYKIVFSKEGYYSKSITFDTHVPEHICKNDCEFPPYQLFVNLLKSVPGVEPSMLQGQIGVIKFNEKADNFMLEADESAMNSNDDLAGILKANRERARKLEEFDIKAKQMRYDSLIGAADDAFNRNEHARAMQLYRDAVLTKPNVEYPRSRVDQCYRILILEELKRTYGEVSQSNVSRYLTYADQKFKEREFTVALVSLQQVSVFQSSNEEVKNKINSAISQIQQLKQLAIDEVKQREITYASRKSRYEEMTQKADQLFLSQKFLEAKDIYAQAAMLIDERAHAVGMIRKIEEMLGSDEAAQKLAKKRDDEERARIQMARDRAYNDAISEADLNMNQRKYHDALEYYELALTIKDFEIYPRKQIASIKTIFADLEAKGLEYNNYVREADELFYKKQYSEARELYELAHNLIRNETYAKQKVAEIDQILASLNKERETEDQYKLAVAQADSLFKVKSLRPAIAAYQKALAVKPQEKYPAQQIRIIREMLDRAGGNQPTLSQIQRDYDNEIRLADEHFNGKLYTQAQNHYQKALALIPGQEYPMRQLRRIAQLMEQAARPKTENILDRIDFANLEKLSAQDRDEAYREAMRLGDSFLASKEWGVARFYYRRALALKPNDVPATRKIDQVEALIRGGDSNEARYNELIQKADDAFKTGDFSVAKFYYAKAGEAKVNDAYVAERLRTIEQLAKTAQQRESNKEYDIAMEKADAAMIEKNYSVARFFYRRAQSLRPDDQVVAQRLRELDAAIKNK